MRARSASRGAIAEDLVGQRILLPPDEVDATRAAAMRAEPPALIRLGRDPSAGLPESFT